MANDIHFRYTSKSNPWKTLRNASDGKNSINVSLGDYKGMSFKDESLLNIPAIVFNDLLTEAMMPSNTTGSFLVIGDRSKNSLHLVDFRSIDIEKISELVSSSTPNDDVIYYYNNPQGFSYTSIGKNFLFGNYFSKNVPTSDNSMQFVDWQSYLGVINAAYITDTISFNVFSNHEGFTPSDLRDHIYRYANAFGIFQTSLSFYGDTSAHYLVAFGSGNETIGTGFPSSFHTYIMNGLCVELDEHLGSSRNHMYIETSGLGYLHMKRYDLSDVDNTPQAIYGRLDVSANINRLDRITTGRRKVSIGEITKSDQALRIFGASFNVAMDVDLDDISRPVKELAEKHDNQFLTCVDTRLKTIKKDRDDIIEDSIYTIDKDFICGYNNMTGKCLCMTLEEETPEIIMPMPLYVSAAGMNVVGYCCDQPSGGGELGYVTDSGYSFARYSTIGDDTGAICDVHPVIIVNPTKQYVTVRRDSNKILYIYANGSDHRLDFYDYFTKEEVDEYMSKDEHELHVGSASGDIEIVSGDVQVYQKDSDGKYVIYQEYPKQIAFQSASYNRTCWECVSANSLSSCMVSWPYSAESTAKAFNKLHGPDNNLIGYIKWGSDFSIVWGGKNIEQLHWHSYYKSNGTTQVSSSWYQPGETRTTTVYSYEVDENGTFSYTSKSTTLEKDKWYAIIIQNPDGGNDLAPYLLEITDENGEIREEHKAFFQSASSRRSCTKKGDVYMFTINVNGGGDKTWSCGSDDFDTYFSTKTNSAGDITEVSVKNRRDLISVFGDACLYYPSSDVCVNCDATLKSKKIYNEKNPICIPEFSGCTFVSC